MESEDNTRESGKRGVTDPLKLRMFEAQKGICWLCNGLMLLVRPEESLRAATYDHVIPSSLGGTWDESNLKLACALCNNRRGNGLQRGAPPRRVYVPRSGSGAKPFSAAWLKDKGYMEAPERLPDDEG